MKAAYGIRRFAQPSQDGRIAPIPLNPSDGHYVETILTDSLCVSFVGRHPGEFEDSLLTSGEWTVGIVGKLFHPSSSSQSDLLTRILAEHQAGKTSLIEEAFGEFVVVIIDRSSSSVTLLSDILSIRPVFHYEDSEQAVFGTDAWALVSAGLVPKSLDLDALSAWLLFDHVIGDRSIIEDLSRLPPASRLKLSAEGAEQESYKKFVIDRRSISDEQLVDQVYSSIHESCVALVDREKKLNCFVSGGYDSRYLLCDLHSSGADLHAFTVRYDSAEEDAAGAVLSALDIDGSAISVPGSVFDLHESNPFYFSPWGFPAWKFVTEVPVRKFTLRDTLVDGLMGEELVRGYDYEQEISAAIDQFGIGEGMLHSYTFVEPHAFRPGLARQIRNRVITQIEDYFRALPDDLSKTAFQWLLFNRKSTCHTTNHLHNQKVVETTHPFVNPSLIDLRLQTSEVHFDNKLYQELFSRYFPRVADIPHSSAYQQRYSAIARLSWQMWRNLPRLAAYLLDGQNKEAFRRGFVSARLASYGAGQGRQFYIVRQLWIVAMLSQRLDDQDMSIPWKEI